MVESLAAGKPVIAYNDGGATEIVSAQTGVLYNELSADSLNKAINKFENIPFSSSNSRNAQSNSFSFVFRLPFGNSHSVSVHFVSLLSIKSFKTKSAREINLVVNQLKQEMQKAAQELDFEKAILLRDKINKLLYLKDDKTWIA